MNIVSPYHHFLNKVIIKSKHNNKQLICTTPGGYKGFYTLGICHFIKDNYNLDNFYFSGASAGAWNSLFFTYNGNNNNFINSVFNLELKDKSTIYNLQYDLKNVLLNNYKTDDFDFKKLYIAVSTLNRFSLKNVIHNDFYSLDDAINCCMASSHIPLITGRLLFKYKNKYTFDGGFKKNPLDDDATLLITASMWNSSIIQNSTEFKIVIKNNLKLTMEDLKYLYELGYSDSEFNKHLLDEILI